MKMELMKIYELIRVKQNIKITVESRKYSKQKINEGFYCAFKRTVLLCL